MRKERRQWDSNLQSLAFISYTLPIELQIKLNKQLEFTLIKIRFFSISRQKMGIFRDFCLEMEKNRLFTNTLISSNQSLDCGRIDLMVGCYIEDLGFEPRCPPTFFLSQKTVVTVALGAF